MQAWRKVAVLSGLLGGLACIFVARYDKTPSLPAAVELALRQQNRAMVQLLETKPKGLSASELQGIVGLSGAFTTWIANASGTILAHPEQRFIGKNAVNIRPVAMALENLRKKNKREIVDSFVGLLATDTRGVYTTLPDRSLVVITEWPANHFFQSTSVAIDNYILLLGIALLLAAVYVWVNSGANLATLGDKSAALLLPRTNIATQSIAHAVLEQFLRQCWKLSTGKQVWQLVTDAFSELYGRTPVIYFRFSATSCALVPEYAAGIESLYPQEQEFLLDTRIYVGKFPQTEDLLLSSAYSKWEAERSRLNPLFAPRWQILRSQTLLHSGFWLIAKTNESTDHEDRVAQIILETGANLYEGKQRLLQSKHGRNYRENMANPPDQLSH